jgi:excisionase family DNA binding protein
LVGVHEIAATINVSARTVWRWVEAGAFPRPELAIGETRRWRLTTVTTWLERQTAAGAEGQM